MFNLSRFSLEGKVALVTGGSRGIGRASALGFAEAGADVAIASRKLPDLEEVADEIRDTGRKALPVATHVGRLDEINKLVGMVMDEFGRIDILVNNAGCSPAFSTVLDAEERLWDAIMNLNLKGLYFLSQAVARVMKEQGGGAIINLSSIEGYRPQFGTGIYSISKTAVKMVTKSMARDLAPYNIRVNAIAPGAIETRLLNNLWALLPEDQARAQKETLAEGIPLKRIGDPEEMVGAMIYLASDASSYVTGTTILIDGGILLR
ncbi:MAG: glucose 1-dehydrogenase [Deltaproteobacteria bacterium]|nr:glucose 1-dehydrogenase [Deltaproteobacteria bacterium]MBW2086955.1 glucose 1-dehydrogenase [Deltaproteobacteria bacterium]